VYLVEDILSKRLYIRKGQRYVRLTYLLCACYGLKNSRKRKPYFTINYKN
jgi:hypothetical protein